MPTLTDIYGFLTGQAFGSTVLPKVSLHGKTIVITGANTGLGFEAARHIARMQPKNLILGCRNLEKGNLAASKITSDPHYKASATSVSVWQVDLNSFESVHAFDDRVKGLPRLDGFIANAGVELVDYHSSEGLEETLTVNIVSTFKLAMGVLPKLQSTAEEHGIDTDIAVVGSCIHVFGPDKQLEPPPEQSILRSLSDEKTADMALRYNLSKLMVHLCFNEYAKQIATPKSSQQGRVVATLVNPGWCGTELARNRDHPLMERVMFRLMGRTAEEGSRTLVDGVVAGRGMHGRYLSECRVKQQSDFVRSARGEEIARRLWKEVSAMID